MTQLRTDKELRAIVQAKYEQLVRDRGEQFNRLSIPLDESDRAAIKKKQRLVVFVVGPLFVLLLSVTLFFVWDGSLFSYLFLGFVGLMAIVVVIIHFYYEDVLQNNDKEIVKGILTNKQKVDDGDTVEYDFEISTKEVINVGRSNFKKFAIGDILEIELLGGQGSLSLTTKVKRTGSIFDDKGGDQTVTQ